MLWRRQRQEHRLRSLPAAVAEGTELGGAGAEANAAAAVLRPTLLAAYLEWQTQ